MNDETGSSNLPILLERWSRGDRSAFDALLTQLYDEIHAIAVRQLRWERRLTIRPTELVHELYLRMIGANAFQFQDRAHFLAMAARVTRQALVDEARRSRAEKRDGGTPVTLSDEHLGGHEAGFDALDVDALLTELHGFDTTAADVVSMRIFGGLSIDETAEALSLSVATVNRRWVTGKAWLAHELTLSS
jgi:RNA polymerase sigma factor (TIGR02999 family)